jgi:hypothetical protein
MVLRRTACGYAQESATPEDMRTHLEQLLAARVARIKLEDRVVFEFGNEVSGRRLADAGRAGDEETTMQA